MRVKIPQLEEAFHSYFTTTMRSCCPECSPASTRSARTITALDTKIKAEIIPFAEAMERLDQIPGVGLIATRVIIAEVGVDMSRFPTPAHLTS